MNTLLKTISIIKTHVVGILKKHCALIRKLEWQVHKDSHCGSKQQCNHSITACLCHIHMGAILHTHRTRGELHIQCNGNGEVATTFPSFYNKPHQSHVLFMKAAPDTTFTSWSQLHFVAIGKPEQQVCKSSHCGSKQQERLCATITLLLLVRATYLGVILCAHYVCGESHINTAPMERLQQLHL